MKVIHSKRSESVERRIFLHGVIVSEGDSQITAARITEPKTERQTKE